MPYRRSPARFLAPLALIAVAIAVYTVIGPSGDTGSGTTTSVGAKTTTATKKPSVRSPRRAKVYVVKSGDTLSGIAQKTGLTVAHIQALNQPLDANTLAVGRRLKLRE